MKLSAAAIVAMIAGDRMMTAFSGQEPCSAIPSAEVSGSPPRAVVVGGGIAGLAAAIRLSEAGVRVTLLEARATLGGRAGSIRVRRGVRSTAFSPAVEHEIIPSDQSEMWVDQAQHVLLGCCTNLLDFYRRLDVLHHIEWHDWYAIVDERGQHHSLVRRALLPAPLNFSLSAFRFGGISLEDRLTIARGLVALIRSDREAHSAGCSAALRNGQVHSGSETTDRRTFAAWLHDQEQPQTAIDLFWNPVIESACNAPVDEIDLATGMQVFTEGVMRHRDAARLGLSRCPLTDLYEPARDHIDHVLTGQRVMRIRYSRSERIFAAETRSGAVHESELIVCALPFNQVPAVLDATLRSVAEEVDPALQTLRFSPILNVHLFFDRELIGTRHAVHPLALMNRPIHWFFFRQRGQHVHAVVSNANTLIDRPEDEIRKIALDELSRALKSIPIAAPDRRSGNRARSGEVANPASIQDHLTEMRVMRERRATFVPSPHAARHRPTAATSVPGFVLAGDWCRTGWPATMEGAVRSGYAAAAAALKRPANEFVVPELRPGLIYRFLAGSA